MSESYDETHAKRLIEEAFPTTFPAGVPRPKNTLDPVRIRTLYRGAYALFSQYQPKEVLCWMSDALVNMTHHKPTIGEPVPEPIQRGVKLFDDYAFVEFKDGADILAICAGAIARMIVVMEAQEQWGAKE